jgi:hypothetical protein
VSPKTARYILAGLGSVLFVYIAHGDYVFIQTGGFATPPTSVTAIPVSLTIVGVGVAAVLGLGYLIFTALDW